MTSNDTELRFRVQRRGFWWTVTDAQTGRKARCLRRHRAQTLAVWCESQARFQARRDSAYAAEEAAVAAFDRLSAAEQAEYAAGCVWTRAVTPVANRAALLAYEAATEAGNHEQAGSLALDAYLAAQPHAEQNPA